MPDLDRKPRLLVLASTYPRWAGDPEPGFVHELSRRLTQHFDVWVLAPHAPGAASAEMLDGVNVRRYRYAPERLETLVHNGGIAVNLSRARWKLLLVPGFLLMQLLMLERLHRRYRYDVLHAHWLIPQGLCAAVFRSLGGRAPFIVSSHGADVFALHGQVFAHLRRFVTNNAAKVGVVSEALSRKLKLEGIEPTRVQVMPMGVDLSERFVPSLQGIQRDSLLFVGRLVEKKGVSQLIEALSLIVRRKPQVRLSIVGTGPEFQLLRQLAQDLKLAQNVIFIGAVHQQELPQWYSAAAVVVAPFVEAESGDQEGLGLVVLEALACGRPVIVGNVEATRELPSQVPGLFRVNARDPGLLAAAILEVLEDPTINSATSVQARVQAASRWDWRIVVRDYTQVLLDAFAGQRP